MGQRNVTYVITERKGYNSSDVKVLPIYNQWNYIRTQLPKMVRGIKAVMSMQKYVRFSYATLDLIYFTAAGVNKYKDTDKEVMAFAKQWVGGRIITDEYEERLYTAAYQEDNNNGWNIVKIIIDDKEDKIDVEIFCVVGRADKGKANNETLEGYFSEKGCTKADIKYLSQFKWNNKLELEAKRLIKKLIPLKIDLVGK